MVFGYFLDGIGKKLLPFSKSVFSSFSICEASCKNKKYLHLRQKMVYLGIFGYLELLSFQSFAKKTPINAQFENNIVIWNQLPQIYVLAKFWEKKWKWLNLWPKMPCLYFWAETLEKLLPYLKSASSILSKMSF